MNHAENIRELISQLERSILYEEWTMDAQYPYSENDYEFVDGEKYFTVEYLKSMPSGYAYRRGVTPVADDVVADSSSDTLNINADIQETVRLAELTIHVFAISPISRCSHQSIQPLCLSQQSPSKSVSTGHSVYRLTCSHLEMMCG